jgi:hypothetical protein
LILAFKTWIGVDRPLGQAVILAARLGLEFLLAGTKSVIGKVLTRFVLFKKI